jgi:hypothetical protein
VDSVVEYLAGRKEAIVQEWLKGTMPGVAGSPDSFLLREPDRFRNPVGHTIKENLGRLFDALLAGEDPGDWSRLLDPIVRIRAVHSSEASEALSFVFRIRDIIRRELATEISNQSGREEWAGLAGRIDALASSARDIYGKCREQACQIQRNEARRRTYVSDRIAMKGARLSKGHP